MEMGKEKDDKPLGPLGKYTPDDSPLPEIRSAGEPKTTRQKIKKILREEEEISRKDLEERLDVTTGRISQVLNKLEEEGWLKREGKRGRLSNRKLVYTGKFETFFKIVEKLEKLCRVAEELDNPKQYGAFLKTFGSVVLGGLKKAREEETEEMKDDILLDQFLNGLRFLILPKNTDEVLQNIRIQLGDGEVSGLEVVEKTLSEVEEEVKTAPREKYGGEEAELESLDLPDYGEDIAEEVPRKRAEKIMSSIVEDAKKYRDIKSCRDCPALMKSKAGIYCHIQNGGNCPLGKEHWENSPYDTHWPAKKD